VSGDVVYYFKVKFQIQKENKMSYKLLFVLSAIVGVIFGLGFLIVPALVLPFFGTTDAVEATYWVARFFGFSTLAFGLVIWFAKEITDAKSQKGLGISMLIVSVIGFALAIAGNAAGNAVIRANSWVPITLFALSSLGYAFMVFIKPKMKE